MNEYINKDFYKQIPMQERHYINLTAEAAEKVMNRLKAENIPFSATLSNYKNVVTVRKSDSERAEAFVREAAPAVNNNRRIIGNTDYRAIADKRYIHTDAETALQITSLLSGGNSSRFSGIITGDKATITVSGEKNAVYIRRMAENIKNADLLAELEAAGFERLPDTNGFVNIRVKATVRTVGFDGIDMVRAMFEDNANEFFHPTAYRIGLTSDTYEDGYYISRYDLTTGKEKSPCMDDENNMLLFRSVDEAITYASKNDYALTNPAEEIGEWRNSDLDHESENISAENRGIIGRFPMQDGVYPDQISFNSQDNSFVWLYYNPDGDNGNGEFVEKYISEQDVYAAYFARTAAENEADGRNAFINSIFENCREAVIDTYSGYFEGYAEEYINKPENVTELYGIGENSVNTDAMNAFISYLEDNCPSVAAEKNKQQKREGVTIDEHSENIEIEGFAGSWYVVDSDLIGGNYVYLLESEIYGDEAPYLVVDEKGTVLFDREMNGFDDYREYVDMKSVPEGMTKIPDDMAITMWEHGLTVFHKGK